MPPAPSCARNRYSPITRGSSAASGFISSPRVGPALHILRYTWRRGPGRGGSGRGAGVVSSIRASAGGLRRQLVERDVQLEHVDRRLPEEAEGPAPDVLDHQRAG